MLPLTQILIHSSFISILIFFIIIIYIFFSSFFLFIIKLKGSKIGYDKLDVHNTFLNRSLREVVYIEQPTSFVDLILATHVCRFHKSFYDLKQAPQSWYTRLNDFFLSIGFRASKVDTFFFILSMDCDICYLLIYVDDILLTGNNFVFV